MKNKIKDVFTTILYISGMFMLYYLIFSLTEGKLSDTKIGKIALVLGGIAGFIIFGFIAYCFVVTIYISIKNYFKEKIQAEVRKEIARQKYLEKQKRNDE